MRKFGQQAVVQPIFILPLNHTRPHTMYIYIPINTRGQVAMLSCFQGHSPSTNQMFHDRHPKCHWCS